MTNRFVIFVFRPLWRQQSESDEFQAIPLISGLFGMLITLWMVLSTSFGYISLIILDEVDREVNLLVLVLSTPILNFILAMSLSAIIGSVVWSYHPSFREIILQNEIRDIETTNFNTMLINDIDQDVNQKEIYDLVRRQFRKELLYFFAFGLVAGVYFSIYYLIPFFFVFILLTLIWLNFVSLSLSFTLGLSITLSLLFYQTLRKITTIKEAIDDSDRTQEYNLSQRNIDIILSNKPPIICPGCRSYISSALEICRICGEEIPSELRN